MSKAGKKLKAVAKERKKEKDLGLNDEAKRELHRTCANVKTALDELFAAVEAVPKAFGDKHQRKSIAGAAFTLSELLGIVQWWYPPPKAPEAASGAPRPTTDSPERINVKGGDPVFPDGSSAKIVKCAGWTETHGACSKLSEPGKNFCVAHKEKPPTTCGVEGCLAGIVDSFGRGPLCNWHLEEARQSERDTTLPPKEPGQSPKPYDPQDDPTSDLDAKGDSTPDAAWTGIPKGV